MAKKISKEVYIRRLSEQDNIMLERVRLLTHQASNSQALLKAGYLTVHQDNQIDEQKRYIAQLEGKLNKFEYYSKNLFEAQENLQELIE